jgi:hypothetical protein
MRCRRVPVSLGSVLGSLGWLALVATPAHAAPGDYVIENVADSSGDLTAFASPAIDELGNVVFLARYKTGAVPGLFAGRAGEAVAPLVDANGPLESFNRPAFANGTVAFRATVDGGQVRGIYTVPLAGGQVTTVALDDGTELGEIGTLTEDVWINDAGTIAFYGVIRRLPIGAGALLAATAQGGGAVAIALEGTPGGILDGSTAINRVGVPIGIDDAGNVLSFSRLGTDEAFWFLLGTAGGSATPIPGIAPASVFSASLGSTGWIAYANTSSGITRRAPGGGLEVVADFALFGGSCSVPAVNATGDVAFSAIFFQSGVFDYGLYVGGDVVEDRVIGKGTPFLGSTIATVTASPNGLNDAGQIAFLYLLADNRTGIAVATLPEPDGALASLAAGAALALARRQRRSQIKLSIDY